MTRPDLTFDEVLTTTRAVRKRLDALTATPLPMLRPWAQMRAASRSPRREPAYVKVRPVSALPQRFPVISPVWAIVPTPTWA